MTKAKIFTTTMLMMLAGWINREQNDLIAYLLEANSILKAKLEKGGKRIRYTDQERARLARKGKKVRG